MGVMQTLTWVILFSSLACRALAIVFQTAPRPVSTVNAPELEFSFNVVADSAGKDASDRISVFHLRRKLPSLVDRRRAASREINNCPAGYIVETSRCVRNTSPQAYSTICRNVTAYENDLNSPAAGVQAHGPDAPFRVFAGSCAPNEFCVESRVGFLTNRVFCISSHSFYLLAHDEIATKSTVGSSRIGLSSDNDHSYAVGVILTSINPQKSVFASNLNIQAQVSKMVHDKPLWQILNTSQCVNCSSIGLDFIPSSVQRIQLNVDLLAGVSTGDVWLTSWIP